MSQSTAGKIGGFTAASLDPRRTDKERAYSALRARNTRASLIAARKRTASAHRRKAVRERNLRRYEMELAASKMSEAQAG